MKNIPKRQHVVQKRLLSNFTSTPQIPYDRQRIWQFDKKTQKSREISLKIAGVRRNFLTPIADKVITHLERECGPTLDIIIGNECMFPKGAGDLQKGREWGQTWFSLYRYVSAQLQRTGLFREEMSRLLPLSRERLREFHSYIFQPAEPEFVDLGGRSNNESKGEIAKLFSAIIPCKSSVPPLRADGLAISLADVTLPLIIINESTVPFIQNDIGLAPFGPFNDTSMTLFADNESILSYVAFPVSPRICVHLCTTETLLKWTEQIPAESNRGMMLTSDKQSRKLTNTQLFRFAKRFVYSNKALEKMIDFNPVELGKRR